MSTEIQSLSVVIDAPCSNNCKFCVSKLSDRSWCSKSKFSVYDFKDRVKYCAMKGCSTAVITSYGEPLENVEEMEAKIDAVKEYMPCIELQTSAVNIKEAFKESKSHFCFGINTVAVSIADIFDDKNNMDIMGFKKLNNFKEICEFVKFKGLNLRVCINLTKLYDDYYPVDIFERCKYYGINQITFRELYKSNKDTKIDKWIEEHKSKTAFSDIRKFIIENGNELEMLPTDSKRYSVMGMSTVIDTDCMAVDNRNTHVMRYAVLYPNGKLYSRWGDPGSLIF